MNDFKVSDEAYILETNQYTIMPSKTIKPRIKKCRVNAYLVCSYGNFYVVDNDYYVAEEWLFKTRQECIDAFKERLDEL